MTEGDVGMTEGVTGMTLGSAGMTERSSRMIGERNLFDKFVLKYFQQKGFFDLNGEL
jgi:hypothetical protein